MPITGRPQRARRALLATAAPELRLRLRAMLSEMSWEAGELVSAEHVWQRYDSGNADIVCLDLEPGKAESIVLIEALRDNPRTRHIPILLFAAPGDGDGLARALEAGGNAFVQKSIDWRVLPVLLETLARAARSIEVERLQRTHREAAGAAREAVLAAAVWAASQHARQIAAMAARSRRAR